MGSIHTKNNSVLPRNYSQSIDHDSKKKESVLTPSTPNRVESDSVKLQGKDPVQALSDTQDRIQKMVES